MPPPAGYTPPLQTASLADLAILAGEAGTIRKPILDPVPPFKSEPPIISRGKIGRGSSFFEEMHRSGLSPATIDHLVRDCRKTFNLKQVHPGQEYTIFNSPQGELDSLRLALRGDKILNLRRSGDQFVAAIDTLSYRVTRHLTSGTIQQSLFTALQAEGADPSLAGQLALIFGWNIDFFTDIRRGDHFTVLYENKNYENGKVVLGRILAARLRTKGENHDAIGYQPAGRSWSYFDGEGKSLHKSLLRAPLDYTRITSNFSLHRLHPMTRHYAPHLGVDYGAPRGTPVKSTGDGTVIAATWGTANGNYIKIKHNRSYTTYYLHLSRFAKGIRTGAKVHQGQVIGYVGSTGLANGPHLDYRIKVEGRFVNPRTIELPAKDPIPAAEMARFARIRDAYLLAFLEELPEDKGGPPVLVEEPPNPRDSNRTTLFKN